MTLVHTTERPSARKSGNVLANNILATVRADFALRGTTLHKWCWDNGVLYANARKALLGTWNGPKADAIRARIVAASRAEVPETT